VSATSVETLATAELLQALETDLQVSVLQIKSPEVRAMADMVAYHFGWTEANASARGKRVRPLLTMLCCAAAGGNWRHALPAASAVELIHNFSLIHDDIQDNSAERRGRATVWKRCGVAQAINTGDALLVLAHLAAHRLAALGVPLAATLDVLRLLDEACLHLTRGQHLDLAFESRAEVNESEYLEMIEGKTAALLSAATTCGARVAEASEQALDHFRQYGRHLGLAFQILDDILGIWGAPQVTGKPAGDDLRAHKKSLPVLFGTQQSAAFLELWAAGSDDEAAIREMTAALERAGALEFARREAEDHTDQALAHLQSAAAEGAAADELRSLTLRLLQRQR
jgi:geranylgeranyl diphosphate synthase, type I